MAQWTPVARTRGRVSHLDGRRNAGRSVSVFLLTKARSRVWVKHFYQGTEVIEGAEGDMWEGEGMSSLPLG